MNGKTGSVRLESANTFILPVFNDEMQEIHTVIDAPDELEAPIAAGQKFGVVRVIYNNREISAIDLIAAESVERKSFFGLIFGTVWEFFTYMVQNFA